MGVGGWVGGQTLKHSKKSIIQKQSNVQKLIKVCTAQLLNY